jgi:hypothetical protein
MSRKPQSNAVLKTLPEERQAEIFSRLTTKTATWLDTSYAAVRKWLALDGVKTSETTLGDFHSWYSLSRQLQRNGSTVEQLLRDLKSAKPEMTPDQLDMAGQMFFTALSIDQQDSLGWQRAQNVKIRSGLLKLEREKFEVLAAEKMLDKALRAKADELNASTLSQADKIAAMRKAAFKDVDELQKSGNLKIPKA